MTAYAAVETALMALCLVCNVGMFAALLMAGRFRRYRYAGPDLPRRHDAVPSRFPCGRGSTRKGGAA